MNTSHLAIPSTWAEIVQEIGGACSSWNIPPAELVAIDQWRCALEADLAHPATAADRSVLGSLGRLMLLEFRLSRSVFSRGATSKTGEIRAALPEFRQVVKLKADLLGRLVFRKGTAPIQLNEYLAQCADAPDIQGSPADDSEATAHRATTEQPAASEGQEAT